MRKTFFPLLVTALFFGVSPLYAAGPLQISISSPHEGAGVPWRPCVNGVVSDIKAEIWLIISDLSGNLYVEPGPLSVRPGGTWVGRPYVAEKKPALFQGLNLEMRAVANPKVPLAEGMVLNRWPPAEASSAVIDVVYQDRAADGCLNPNSSAGMATSSPSPKVSSDTSEVWSPGVDPPSYWGNHPVVRTALEFLAVVLGLLFVALIAMPDLASGAVDYLTRWLTAFVKWLVKVAVAFTGSVVRLYEVLAPVSKAQSPRIWRGRGFVLDFRLFSVELLAIVPLWIAMVFAFYGESATIVKSLNELFGVESNTTSEETPGLVLGIMNSSNDGPDVAQSGQDRAKEKVQGGFGRFATRWLARISQAFERLWESEPLGFWAISLAFLQAVYSLVLLWNLKFTEPLNLRIWTLLRDRPLMTEAFLVLTLALTALAAYRGAKVTVGPDWVLSMVISGALSLCLPVILGLTAHYAHQATADCLGLVKVATVIAIFNIGLAALLAMWSIVLLLLLIAIGIVFTVYATFFAVASAYLLFAMVLGDLLKRLRGVSSPGIGVGQMKTAGGIIAALLMFGALVTYFLVRG